MLLGGPKQRVVLAHLILNANHVVTADRLIDAIWGDEPPDTARNTLQTYIRHLRKGLGAQRIQHRSAGYALIADSGAVDVHRFQSLVANAQRLVSEDLPGASAALREALGLWRGPALDDLADRESLRPEIIRLEELRMAALEERIAADLALGCHRDLVAELEALIVRHPYRERLRGQLMTALYRSGRQSDALSAYREARDALTDELGIDPSPELRRLQEQILMQDRALELGGTPLRGYRLLENIGEGAFGAVHRAFQPEVGREVAVKVIRAQLANDPEFIRRFGAEAQKVARLEHPHIAPLYDYWREPEGTYLVMRYLRGGSLRQALAGGRLEDERVMRLIDQVASAMAVAHRQGVIHRDVKPANILFDEDGNAYLTDFGIAKDLASAAAAEDWGTSSPLAYYLSPEEARGEVPTARADIYGLGLVLYEALTGRHPFADSPLNELPRKHMSDPLPSVVSIRADLPRAVDEVIARATAKDPAERWTDAPALAAALRDAWAQPRRVAARVKHVEARNPYKGLRAFSEADASDFHGREASTKELLARLKDGRAGRFVAVVGPSGSGKSSLVRAGLVPELRRGAVPGSDTWFVLEMHPGTHPFEELERALTRIAVAPLEDLAERMENADDGLLQIAEEILPHDGSELLVVIDQFEEVFSLCQTEDLRTKFLAAIVAATTHPQSRVRVVVTLRADFYDKPLLYQGFGELLATQTYAVAPLSVSELERAVTDPAESVGVQVEHPLVAEVVAEVADRPGGLPLLQYALTELFENRSDSTLSLEAYHQLGGVSGALVRRAEALFGRLGEHGREATRQLFLRLVSPGDVGSEDIRRRVLQSELMSLEVDREAMEAAIDSFGAHRLLSFDRDPVTRGPTVEVAHETLLREWARLRGWIESAREDLRIQARLAAAASEWLESGESSDYLLTGNRLTQLEEGTSISSIKLAEQERRFLHSSLARADADRTAEAERRAHEARLERRALTRLRALVAILAVASLIAATLTIVAVNRSREADRQRLAVLLSEQRDSADRLTAASVASLDTDPELSLLLSLHAVDVVTTLGEPIPATTVEALHWAMQESGIEYPVADGPAVVVDGPLGRRGVFDLPLSDLANLGLEKVHRSLTSAECDLFFGATSCPAHPNKFAADLDSERIREAETSATENPLDGTSVSIMGVAGGPVIGAFETEVNRAVKSTGIDVRVEAFDDFEGQVISRARAGDPPDIALFPQPGSVHSLGVEGFLIDLGTYLDVERLKQDYNPYLVSLGTVGPDGAWPSNRGHVYGVMQEIGVKSLVWFPVPEFRAAGYSTPRTWRELTALSARLRANGQTPWCMGLESGEADGWPATDWIENLVLGAGGPKLYDRWISHEIPFTHPVIRRAFERFGEIVFEDGYLHLGTGGAIRTDFLYAQFPMVEADQPQCWLHHLGSFAKIFLPAGSVPNKTDIFPFPFPNARYRDVVLGGGVMVAAFSDRPEVREVVKSLLSPQFRSSTLVKGVAVSANRRFDRSIYGPFMRRQAELLDAALAADKFRFDGSDLMPPEVGQSPFWNAMMKYVAEGPGSLDGILRDLDEAWPEDD